MARKRRKTKKSEITATTSLLDFLTSEKVEKSKEEEKKVAKEPTPTVAGVAEDVLAKVEQYLALGKRVPKSRLYQWSKRAGIKPADLYRALSNLEKRGVLKKAFDADLEEIVYIYKG